MLERIAVPHFLPFGGPAPWLSHGGALGERWSAESLRAVLVWRSSGAHTRVLTLSPQDLVPLCFLALACWLLQGLLFYPEIGI